MSVDLTEVRNTVAAILNITRGGFGNWSTKVDPRWSQTEVDNCVKAAARAVMAAIFENPNHWARASVLELRTFGASPALINGPIGGVIVDGKEGTLIKPSKLRRFATNRLSLTTITGSGYYSIAAHGQGHVITYLGSSLQVETMKTLDSNDLLVPDVYYGAVLDGGLYYASPKEGTNVQMSANFGEGYNGKLRLIKEGASVLPAATPFAGRL